MGLTLHRSSPTYFSAGYKKRWIPNLKKVDQQFRLKNIFFFPDFYLKNKTEHNIFFKMLKESYNIKLLMCSVFTASVI